MESSETSSCIASSTKKNMRKLKRIGRHFSVTRDYKVVWNKDHRMCGNGEKEVDLDPHSGADGAKEPGLRKSRSSGHIKFNGCVNFSFSRTQKVVSVQWSS